MGRCNQTHLQGNLCSLWKQSYSKNLLGTPNTVPYSRMGYNSLQGKAGLCCSPPRSNVQVDMVLQWLLSLMKKHHCYKKSFHTIYTLRGQLCKRTMSDSNSAKVCIHHLVFKAAHLFFSKTRDLNFAHNKFRWAGHLETGTTLSSLFIGCRELWHKPTVFLSYHL